MKEFAKLGGLGLPALLLAGCVPSFYDGVAATLDESSPFEVIRSDRSWGDCYYAFATMPTVHQTIKDDYTFTITQGHRYWPEFFLEARLPTGAELDLRGKWVQPVEDRRRIRPLREARGTNPTHKTFKLNNLVGKDHVTVEILNESGMKLGEEVLYFKLVDVSCMGWDSV